MDDSKKIKLKKNVKMSKARKLKALRRLRNYALRIMRARAATNSLSQGNASSYRSANGNSLSSVDSSFAQDLRNFSEIRENYFQHLQRVVTQNCTFHDATVSEETLKKMALELEQSALLTCMQSEIYKTAMMNIITDIKKATDERQVHRRVRWLLPDSARQNVDNGGNLGNEGGVRNENSSVNLLDEAAGYSIIPTVSSVRNDTHSEQNSVYDSFYWSETPGYIFDPYYAMANEQGYNESQNVTFFDESWTQGEIHYPIMMDYANYWESYGTETNQSELGEFSGTQRNGTVASITQGSEMEAIPSTSSQCVENFQNPGTQRKDPQIYVVDDSSDDSDMEEEASNSPQMPEAFEYTDTETTTSEDSSSEDNDIVVMPSTSSQIQESYQNHGPEYGESSQGLPRQNLTETERIQKELRDAQDRALISRILQGDYDSDDSTSDDENSTPADFDNENSTPVDFDNENSSDREVTEGTSEENALMERLERMRDLFGFFQTETLGCRIFRITRIRITRNRGVSQMRHMWRCEKYIQLFLYFKMIRGLTAEERQARRILFRRYFGDACGDEHEGNYMSEQKYRQCCIERIFSWVVKYLMFFYQGGRIVDKRVFKKLGCYIAKMIVKKVEYPDEWTVKYYVSVFFPPGATYLDDDDVYRFWLG